MSEHEHEHDHVLTMSGAKKENYFKFLEALEDATFRKEFEADPQSKLPQFGIKFDDLSREIVEGNLPEIAKIREYRRALEDAAEANRLTSHGHLIWDFLTGQPPLK